MRDLSDDIYKTPEQIEERITKLEQEAQLLPPGRVLEVTLREIRQLRSLAVAKRWMISPGLRCCETKGIPDRLV
ncbi:hypothetical protein [Bradyrhizobium sp. JYMT SZCCT0180]|uniref:hypothetical protein n=1 Tax=Bradyrhizobium sp. JYMT SZCCT0180 TaxID=2807666 RepID=UPI001BA52541|nr:hypothetical protein [Bradyrhizobium sp. JYMT SZCCT0180]MBR1216222.1 hypothetical protein [Bradyrhizobium sp. JYMT SZCCT0180]